MLAPPPGGMAPFLRGILDPPLQMIYRCHKCKSQDVGMSDEYLLFGFEGNSNLSNKPKNKGDDQYVCTVVDLHTKFLDTPPSPGSNFFQLYAVFGRFWQNRTLAPPPPEGWCPHLGEILDPPLVYMYVSTWMKRLGSS